jgi:hypothetical protein
MTSVNNESLIITKPTIIEENLQSKSESTIDQNTKNVYFQYVMILNIKNIFLIFKDITRRICYKNDFINN